MTNGLPAESASLGRSHMASAASLVRHVVVLAKPDVEEDHSYGAPEREESNDRADPQSPGVRSQVLGDDVGGGLSCELSKVGDTPRVYASEVKERNGR